MPTKDGRGDCTTCSAKCCRYITIEIPRPTRKVDVDEIRWFLAHADIEVYIEDGDWYVQVNTRCKHLTEDNRCMIYGDRYQVCRDYDVAECEDSEGELEATVFRSVEDFDAYWAKKTAKRKKRRAAHKKSPPPSARVKPPTTA